MHLRGCWVSKSRLHSNVKDGGGDESALGHTAPGTEGADGIETGLLSYDLLHVPICFDDGTQARAHSIRLHVLEEMVEIHSLESLGQVQELLGEWDPKYVCQFLLEFGLDDSRTGAALGAKAVENIMEIDGGFDPVVHDCFDQFPDKFNEADAAGSSTGLGEDGQ